MIQLPAHKKLISLTDLAEKAQRNQTPQTTVMDLAKEMNKKYLDHLWECVAHGKKKFPSGDFYVTKETQRKRLYDRMISSNHWIPKRFCPSPHPDQTVWFYDREADKLEFVWILPDMDTCVMYKNNVPHVEPMEYEVLSFVLRYYDGDLDEEKKRRDKITFKKYFGLKE